MEGKKISFGFKKTKKIEKPVIEEKKDYIECVEEKSIKVVGGDVVIEDRPLVIPMKPNSLITTEKLKEIAEKVEKSLEELEEKEIKTEPEEEPENETIDQMAVRELLAEAKKEVKAEIPALTVPIPAKPVLEGDKESTLDDYESVPVEQFGLAMLRGMGWTPGSEKAKYKQPQLRPKGLGLGADKVVKENQKKKSNKDNEEELTIVKNSYVKITSGKYSGYYGKVVSLDEDMGRVVVDIPIKKETVSLSEFMMHPVTKSEYDKESKVLNADLYEEYKKNENIQRSSKHNSSKVQDKEASSSKRYNNKVYENEKKNKEESNIKDYDSNGRAKDRDRNHRLRDNSSEEKNKPRKKDKKKYRDTSTSSSESEKRKHKNKKRYSSSESEDSDSYRKDKRRKSKSLDRKRDIDKKRKGKKKKRDRDRSPHYKKHRK